MKTHLLIGAFLLLGLSAFSQAGRLKKADNYYEKLSYAYAAELYESLIGSEVDSPKMIGKLATSYYQMGDTQQAEKYFAQMILSPDVLPENYFHYAQALKQNGKYTESDIWMRRFHENSQADIRGISFDNDHSYVQTIEKQSNHFEIKNLAVNTAAADFGGYPSPAGTEAYFVSSRKQKIFVQHEWSWNNKSFLDLYKATVASSQELEQPTAITRKVNTRFHEGPICFSPDGKTVYYTRNNISRGKHKRDQKGIQNLELYRATIENGKWTREEVLPFNSAAYSVGHPTMSADGKILYFASDMPGGFGGADLYQVELRPEGEFGPVTNLGKAYNTEGQEMFPWINSEGYLFFSSNGHIGLGGLDVFVMLPSKKGGAGKLINAGKPVNSQNDDFGWTMNKDNKSGYFSSNRAGGKGDDDIYAYQLVKPLDQPLILNGTITEVATKDILPGSTIYLKNDAGEVLQTAIADAKGAYSFELEPDLDYTVSASKPTYFDNQGMLSTKNLRPGTDELRKDLNLEKDPGLALYCLITDKKTGMPLEGATVKIIDNITGEEFLAGQTPESGDLQKGISDKKVNDRISYNISIQKEGYLGKTLTFNQQITQPGTIKVHQVLDLTLDKLDVGTDLATIIDIKPIYFDLGKSVIRKDAALELDKIVKVMNEYPTMQIELGSHTDCRASMAFNEKLSTSRANASAAYIKAKIQNPERIYGKGYGEYKLKVDCPCEGAVKSTCSEEEHQQNRRTEFVILKM
jgi:outer membrane protein OmpA-like peptidoglycan-associated protein/tetratricopeptide (TPR) repeat protein